MFASRLAFGGHRAGWCFLSFPAVAADAPVVHKAPPTPAAAFDWNGIYLGGHVGYGRGDVRNTLFDPLPSTEAAGFGSLYGGIQAGYNRVFPSGFLPTQASQLARCSRAHRGAGRTTGSGSAAWWTRFRPRRGPTLPRTGSAS